MAKLRAALGVQPTHGAHRMAVCRGYAAPRNFANCDFASRLERLIPTLTNTDSPCPASCRHPRLKMRVKSKMCMIGHRAGVTTGGNWAGPIGEFRLVVDKGDPSNLVSFCADGVKKISATEFEVRKKNFVPSKDLNVLILTSK